MGVNGARDGWVMDGGGWGGYRYFKNLLVHLYKMLGFYSTFSNNAESIPRKTPQMTDVN